MTRSTLLPCLFLILTLFVVFQRDGFAQGQYDDGSYGPPGHQRRQGHPHGGPPGRVKQGGGNRPSDVVFPDEIGTQTEQSVYLSANVGEIDSIPTNTRDSESVTVASGLAETDPSIQVHTDSGQNAPINPVENANTGIGAADTDGTNTRIFSGSGGLNFLTGAVNAAAGLLGIPLNIESSVNPSHTAMHNQNYDVCMAPRRLRGKCIFARNCMYREFAQSEQLFSNYACTIQRQYVGICCPENFIRQPANQGGYGVNGNYGGSTGTGGYGYNGRYPASYVGVYPFATRPDTSVVYEGSHYGNQGEYLTGTTDTGAPPLREGNEGHNELNSNAGGYGNSGSYPNYGGNVGQNVPPQYGGQNVPPQYGGQTYPNVYPPERPQGNGGWSPANPDDGWSQGNGGGRPYGNGNGRPHGNGNGNGRPHGNGNGGRPHGNGGRPQGNGNGGRPHGNGGRPHGNGNQGGRPGGRPKPPQRPWSNDEKQTSAALYEGCGVSFTTRIVGGIQSEKEQWPWMGALLRPTDMKQPFCGGALINERCLLTAAHCTNGMSAQDINVRLGEYDFSRDDDDQHQDFTVSRIRQHEMYDKSTNLNDISILILDRPARLGDDVNPICLPDPNEWVADKQATVAGWGTMSYGGSTSPVLRHVTVPVWQNPECYKALKKNITRNFLCAANKDGGQDSCQGDSGGPLMFEDKFNRWHVIGVVSWGIRCAEKNSPGVYSRVARYLPWIIQNCRA